MGRRAKKLTADQKAQVEALAAYLSQDQIADYLGITRPTFSAMKIIWVTWTLRWLDLGMV